MGEGGGDLGVILGGDGQLHSRCGGRRGGLLSCMATSLSHCSGRAVSVAPRSSWHQVSLPNEFAPMTWVGCATPGSVRPASRVGIGVAWEAGGG